MTREEAIKVIKDNWPEGRVLLKLALEFLIPELKESEDERIRKALIESFEIHDLKALIIPGFSSKDVIAWLKKLGEQKSAWNEKIKGLNELETYILSLVPDRPLDVIKVDAKNIRHIINKEKNPTEDNCKISDCDTKVDMTEYNKGFECGKQRVLKYPEDFNLCEKSASAWIEEDDIELERVVGLLEGWMSTFKETFYAKECKRGISWLKVLKERVQPKQKCNWSEEDENMLQNILECLKNGWSKLSTDILKYESWLESFKERVGNFDDGYKAGFSAAKYNQWKPSDEQMEIIYKYAEQNNYDGTVLTSLYQDLKKLKGE